MKNLFAAAIIGFSMVVAGSALAAPKVDRNSAEHKAWVENFQKKHNIKPKSTAKPKATKPAKKPAAKSKPSNNR